MGDPYWMEIAKAEHGTAEIQGGENPRILEYFRSTSYHATEDEVPWCAAFVSWVLEQCGLANPSTVRARDFEAYGTEISEWKPGASKHVADTAKAAGVPTHWGRSSRISWVEHAARLGYASCDTTQPLWEKRSFRKWVQCIDGGHWAPPQQQLSL